jgi:hypothetical protein
VFSPDGKTLAAAGWQNTFRGEVWLCRLVPEKETQDKSE